MILALCENAEKEKEKRKKETLTSANALFIATERNR